MPTTRTSRAASTARTEILAQLKDDHKRVRKAYKDFQKLDLHEDREACEAIVQQVLQELTVHATLEEELLYPAARGAIADEDLVDEAEVEHGSVHALIQQLEGMTADDDKYAARFTVLCEYVLHHVKEEEGQMFPQLESARLDWEVLAAEMTERRAELMDDAAESVSEGAASATELGDGEDESEAESAQTADPSEEDADPVGTPVTKPQRSPSRSRAQRA